MTPKENEHQLQQEKAALAQQLKEARQKLGEQEEALNKALINKSNLEDRVDTLEKINEEQTKKVNAVAGAYKWLRHEWLFWWFGPNLKKSLTQLFNELPYGAKPSTLAFAVTALIRRVTRIGILGTLLAIIPLILLAFQTLLFFNQNKLVSKQTALFEQQNKKIDLQNSLVERQTNLLDQQNAYVSGQMGLLNNQNKFVEKQTMLLINQNELIARQNDKIDRQYDLDMQSYILEADQQKSYTFLMNKALDKINSELAIQKNKSGRTLSKETLRQIVSLASVLKPYTYLKYGRINKRALSPEKALLLSTITRSNLDTATLDFIFKNVDFSSTDLRDLNLESAYLVGISLSNSLTNMQTSFKGANLSRALLKDITIDASNFKNAVLDSAKFDSVKVLSANFSDASMVKVQIHRSLAKNTIFENVDLTLSIITDSYFEKTNLSFVNLEKAQIINSNWLNTNLYSGFLYKTFIKESSLKTTYLANAIFISANLASCTGLSQKEIDIAFIDYHTQIPVSLSLRRSFRGNYSKGIFSPVPVSGDDTAGFFPMHPAFYPELNMPDTIM